MLRGECAGLDGYDCECGKRHELQVLYSYEEEGWYLGYTCPENGPISKETRCFPSYEPASAILVRIHIGLPLADDWLRK